jgi:thiol:disulfide interchange protein DsbA
MKLLGHSLALALLLASLSACAREHTATPAPGASAPAAASADAPAAVTPAAAAQAGDIAAAAATQQEGTDLAAPTADSGSAQLERIAALPAEGKLPAGKWVPGTNYKVISPAQPTNVGPGKVEVIEMFWYGCPHCFALDPVLESWRKNKADYIEFVRVPVTWSDVHRAHAHLFYTLQALGKLDELHAKVFAEIHQNNNMLFSQNDPMATQRAQVQFAKDNGISEADFMKAYNSFAVQTKLQEADDLTRRYRIEAVPTLVIAGKYETDMQQAGGESNLLQLINDLAASEKRH